MTANKGRIEWIDCAKGITMLLVIFSHSVHGVLRGAIFSFHMPLFFVLSCLTYRWSLDYSQYRNKTKKAFLHLVVPALALFALMTVAEILTLLWEGNAESLNGGYFGGKALTLLFASGAKFTINGLEINRLGIPWFLIALFLGRSLLDLIQLKMNDKAFAFVCTAMSVAGVLIGQKSWLPLSLDVTLAAMFFMLCGRQMKKYDPQRYAVFQLLCAALIWIASLLVTYILADTYLELAIRRYPLFPLCYVTALAGTWMMSQFSFLLTKYGRRILKPILFCGENSLILLCVHAMDFLWEWGYDSSNAVISAVIRVVLDLGVFAVVMLIRKKLGKTRRKVTT